MRRTTLATTPRHAFNDEINNERPQNIRRLLPRITGDQLQCKFVYEIRNAFLRCKILQYVSCLRLTSVGKPGMDRNNVTADSSVGLFIDRIYGAVVSRDTQAGEIGSRDPIRVYCNHY